MSVRCIDGEYSYRGVKARIVVYASAESVCGEVKEAASGGVQGVLGFIGRHGGCRVDSESPLRISSIDGEVVVEVEPANMLARMMWGTIVGRVKETCRG